MGDLTLVHAGELVTCEGDGGPDGNDLRIIEDGALICRDGKVAWTGTSRQLEAKSVGKHLSLINAKGCLVTPGFVDPHTHLVFAGSREDELERKGRGESYASILEKGGGIARTVRETRRASVAAIVAESKGRLEQLFMNGVTTAEVKTGYGQNTKNEIRLLEAISRLSALSPVELVSTFMGLHSTPPEFKSAREYVDYAVREMLPKVAAYKHRPSFSDCFCEEGIFSTKECERYLMASSTFGLARKVHADEFGDSGGARLAAKTGCVSADHLGMSSEDGIEQMARNGVTAVLLPGTSLFSGIPYADSRRFAKAGCRVALGTDMSPNSWVESPQLVMGLACTAGRMTPAQALRGFTANAAKAIGKKDLGRLVVGAGADFVIFSHPNYRYLPYRVGGKYVQSVVKSGKEVYRSNVG